MDVMERADAVDVVYSQAGVALPRRAQARLRTGERCVRTAAAPVRYTVQAFMARASAMQTTLEDAYRLRARVFMRELGWLTPSADGREYDRCDPLARHFAVFAHDPAPLRETPRAAMQDAPLVGYARVLLPRHGFMLQHEFVELLPEPAAHYLPDTQRAFEVSRFVITPLHRGRRCVEGYTAADHLARAIAQWALSDGRTDWWTVCEARHLRALRLRGLRFTQLGGIVEYQPGVEACAAMLHLPMAADELRQRRADDYAWYAQGYAQGYARDGQGNAV